MGSFINTHFCQSYNTYSMSQKYLCFCPGFSHRFEVGGALLKNGEVTYVHLCASQDLVIFLNHSLMRAVGSKHIHTVLMKHISRVFNC